MVKMQCYSLMGSPSHMQPIIDQNVITQYMTVPLSSFNHAQVTTLTVSCLPV